MPRAGKPVVRFRPRGSVRGWHKEQVKCAQCHGAGLLSCTTEHGELPVCPKCNGRGYTVDYIRHARALAEA
jgi:DnaJ-class molecular chaperone